MRQKAERSYRLEEYQKGFFESLKHKVNKDVRMKVAPGWEKPIKKIIKMSLKDEVQHTWSSQA